MGNYIDFDDDYSCVRFDGWRGGSPRDLQNRDFGYQSNPFDTDSNLFASARDTYRTVYTSVTRGVEPARSCQGCGAPRGASYRCEYCKVTAL